MHVDRVELHGDHADSFARLGSPDVLIHLAWGGLPNYRDRKHADHELPAQRRFLGALLASGLKRLVVTGTCAEYGLREGALDETMPAEPLLEYAKAKDSLRRWLEGEQRNHREAQTKGRGDVLRDYRLRVAGVLRDYGMDQRDDAPADSRAVHG